MSTPARNRWRRRRTNVDILDAMLRHRHWTYGRENALAAELHKVLRRGERELLRLAATPTARGVHPTAWARAVDRVMLRTERELQRVMDRGLAEIAQRELAIHRNLLGRVVPNGVGLDLGSPVNTLGIARRPVLGMRVADRISRNTSIMRDQLRRTLALARATDASGPALRNGIRRDLRRTGLHRLTAQSRYEVQRIANGVGREVAVRNPQAVKAMQVVETLDDLTCIVCATKDGTLLAPGQGDGPPYHAHCRGVEVPVLASWQEMGLDPDGLTDEQMSMLDGAVPVTVRYPDWLERQPAAFQRKALGPARYELWRAGDLTLDQMVRDNRVVPLRSLERAA